MISISQEESFYVKRIYPDVCIVVINKEHSSKAKRYVMTAEKRALSLIVNTNIAARRELLQMLNNELYATERKLSIYKGRGRVDTGLENRLKKILSEIQDIKNLGV